MNVSNLQNAFHINILFGYSEFTRLNNLVFVKMMAYRMITFVYFHFAIHIENQNLQTIQEKE